MTQNQTAADTPLDEPQETTTEHTEERHYASIQARMLASIIDSALSLLPLLLLGIAFQVSAPALPHDLIMKTTSGQPLTTAEHEAIQQLLWYQLTNFSVQFVILSIIIMALWIKFAATPGKMMLGMKVIDDKTSNNPSVSQSLWRIIGMVIATMPLFLGIFWIQFSKKRQGWHDMAADTVVVYTEKSIYHRVATKYARLLSGRKT